MCGSYCLFSEDRLIVCLAGTDHIYVWEWPSLREVQILNVVEYKGSGNTLAVGKLNDLEWVERRVCDIIWACV